MQAMKVDQRPGNISHTNRENEEFTNYLTVAIATIGPFATFVWLSKIDHKMITTPGIYVVTCSELSGNRACDDVWLS
jgi:hypothetical protein